MDNLKKQMKNPRAFSANWPPEGQSLAILKNGVEVGRSDVVEEDFIMAGLAGGVNKANIERLANTIFSTEAEGAPIYWGIKDRGESIKVTLEK